MRIFQAYLMLAVADTASNIISAVAVTVAMIALAVNVWLVYVSQQQARIMRQTITEVQLDRMLAYWPYLIRKESSNPRFHMRLWDITNVGKGPAIQGQFFVYDPIGSCWYRVERFDLAGGESREQNLSKVVDLAYITGKRGKELADLDGWTEESKMSITVLTCVDQFGNTHRYRSNLEEPEVWTPSPSPRWVRWSQRLERQNIPPTQQ